MFIGQNKGHAPLNYVDFKTVLYKIKIFRINNETEFDSFFKIDNIEKYDFISFGCGNGVHLDFARNVFGGKKGGGWR